ncbi:hypothetical protein LEP1GSC170_0317, partial [Leptospira interrogans serovar Bataviae str. HAI135]
RKKSRSSWFSFQTFLSREYPIQYLEGLKTNFEISNGLLSRYKRKFLFLPEKVILFRLS